MRMLYSLQLNRCVHNPSDAYSYICTVRVFICARVQSAPDDVRGTVPADTDRGRVPDARRQVDEIRGTSYLSYWYC